MDPPINTASHVTVQTNPPSINGIPGMSRAEYRNAIHFLSFLVFAECLRLYFFVASSTPLTHEDPNCETISIMQVFSILLIDNLIDNQGFYLFS